MVCHRNAQNKKMQRLHSVCHRHKQKNKVCIAFAIAINKNTLVVYRLLSQKAKTHGFDIVCHGNQHKQWFIPVAIAITTKHIGVITFAIAIITENNGFIAFAITMQKQKQCYNVWHRNTTKNTLVLQRSSSQ